MFEVLLLLFVVTVPGTLDLTGTSEAASAAGSDQTDLLAGRAVAGDGRGVTNVLMVTTTVRVLNGVTGNTTDLGPAVALDAEAVVGVTGLEDGLFDTATTSDEADAGAAGGGDGLLLAGGELEAGLAGLVVVGDDDAVVAGGLSHGAAVADLSFDVADDATFGDVAELEDVADGEGSLSTAHDGLTGEHTFSGDEEFLDALELVGVAEFDLSEGGTTAGVVSDVLNGTAHVTVALTVVEGTEAGSTEALVAVNVEDGGFTVTTGKNSLSHFVLLKLKNAKRNVFGVFLCESTSVS